ncbi:oxidoreductase-like domain-containing protein [Mitsuaria sp. GD03876]|uniref:oxidoreductase-like domain-containing protein n=1 Tax=Mitsuaria sp. GD03876 TaxID=2975399 RepID=UPI0024469EEA|nr:oxidoreductase-like domain-containing protein [Mitsuaria sp. GD03876]MDH0865477.1 oxidoreductase-like domain-containing protein [Mitsuaria sp. GD03876]
MTTALPDPAPAASAEATDAGDPMPVPPVQPDLDACCGNGCDPCIFDLHDLAMDDYRQRLRAWKARHPEAS